ncbi:uncharacterized protein FA14DRAFT_189207 [Meira miltonrushii]|uniref:Uncharacterized protein n=1 Tax=Meira miltonrushii TaxID=1280837 RepID=A0A316VC23_9BASI|nr:uncharacterized protein FA14DRAFT_189207 [Meira miltonrushii]PWN35217.1 hypothetical protein FA14DRAFT_189207 [Meira miltonrushii]
MSGRSTRISTLSDKIQGLKFMQRASASSPSTSASTSTPKVEQEEAKKKGKSSKDQQRNQGNSFSSLAASEPATITSNLHKDEEDAEPSNEEHWVMPNAKEKIARQSSSKSIPRIESQSGWNDWLGQLQNGESSAQQSPSSAGAARRSFGAWAPKLTEKKGSKGKEEDDSEEDEFTGGESEEDIQQKGFIKPGSLSDTPLKKQKGRKRKSDDNHGNSKLKDELMGDIRKQKKKKTKDTNGPSSTDSHAKARQESAIKKRKDMASTGKAGKRQKEGFLTPNMNRQNDDDQFKVSDNDDTLEGF